MTYTTKERLEDAERELAEVQEKYREKHAELLRTPDKPEDRGNRLRGLRRVARRLIAAYAMEEPEYVVHSSNYDSEGDLPEGY